MNIELEISNYLDRKIELLKDINHESIINAYKIIQETVDSDNSIFTCGNGGSAYCASHFVTDWSKMYLQFKNKKLKCFSLNDNFGIITAYANDISFESIYSEQLKSLSKKNDLLILISGSGNSKNLIEAANTAKEIGLSTLGILGFDGGKLNKICDNVVLFPINDMQLAEDMHLSFGHIIMKLICK